MTRWNIATNEYYFTGCIILEKASWYIFALEYCIQLICDLIPAISLPKIKIRVDNEETTLREYYGTLADLFHVYVCNPICQWCFSRTQTEWIYFPYFMLKEKFPDIVKENGLFTEEEVAVNKIKSKLINNEFKIIYDKLKNHPQYRCNS